MRLMTKLAVISVIAMMAICPAIAIIAPADAGGDVVYKGAEIELTTKDVERLLSQTEVIPRGMSLKQFMQTSLNDEIKSGSLSILDLSVSVDDIDYHMSAKALAEGGDGSVLTGSFAMDTHVDMTLTGYLPSDGTYRADNLLGIFMSLSKRSVKVSADVTMRMTGTVTLDVEGNVIESADLNFDGVSSASAKVGADVDIVTDNQGKVTRFTVSYVDTMYHLNVKTHARAILDVEGMDLFSHSNDPVGTTWMFNPVITVKDLEADLFLDASDNFTDPLFDRMGTSVYDKFLKTTLKLSDYINADGTMDVDLKKLCEDSLGSKVAGSWVTMQAMARLEMADGQKVIAFNPVYSGLADGSGIDVTEYFLETDLALENLGIMLPAVAEQVDFDYFKQLIEAAVEGAPEDLDLEEFKDITGSLGYAGIQFREYSASEAEDLREEISGALSSEFADSGVDTGAVTAALVAILALSFIGAAYVYRRP